MSTTTLSKVLRNEALQVNSTRLNRTLHEGCEFGKDHKYGALDTETGMARLSLSDSDKDVRNWLLSKGEELGCKTFYDAMGNLFIIRPGKDTQAPPIMMGSHLDTQPTGGRYDGILGVTAGLEVLRVLHENKFETNRSIGLANWTNEEGARFPSMAVASGVWAGVIPIETAWDLQEVPRSGLKERKTMKEELTRIGFLGTVPASYDQNPFAAHFELHIEQGPILEEESRKIGVVQGVQAFRWFEISVSGRDSHAGTTPLYARRDSLLCCAKLIVASNEIAKEYNGLATTGIINAEPGSVNTMAHTVTFTLDIRHTSDERLSLIENGIRERFTNIAKNESEKGCSVVWKELVNSPAVTFDESCIAAVKNSAIEACRGVPNTAKDGEQWKYITSGAGHDSCYTNRRCPTAMIFTPTKDGISHNPQEYCSPEDCAFGAQVLLGAVLRYDEQLESAIQT